MYGDNSHIQFNCLKIEPVDINTNAGGVTYITNPDQTACFGINKPYTCILF